MSRIKIAVAVVGVVCLGLLLLLPKNYDRSQVLPAVRDLPRPFQKVVVEWYLDGGSIGLEITDAAGRTTWFALPVDSGPGKSRQYPRLFVGARSAKHSNAVEVAFSPETRRYLGEILQEDASGPYRDVALIALRGSFRDYFGGFSRFAYRTLLER